mgnify:CR=1 FL=1
MPTALRSVPEIRARALNEQPLRPERRIVLYWMTAYRRSTSNFALDLAADIALELGRPLLVFEPLRAGYRWASDRLHRFVIEGMRDNRDAFAGTPVTYLPYVEPTPGAGRGLLEALAADACAVVTDEFPCFFLPRMQAAAARRLDVRIGRVDGVGLLPLRALPQVDGRPRRFDRAVDLRRHMQRALPEHLAAAPRPDGVAGLRLARGAVVRDALRRRWPAADLDALLAPGGLAHLPIDHDVAPCPATPGGARAAAARLDAFLSGPFASYAERNHPDDGATSGLSPYLHFGHVGTHEVLRGVADVENWLPERLANSVTGSREGWWGMSAAGEGFLDQVVTWRELCFHTAFLRPDAYDTLDSLPDWARRTLDAHAGDVRSPLYDEATLDAARTHDPLWNAAQRELRESGAMHNYLRMLWGKKVLEWTASPAEALRILVHLNNRYALDGRDPNSYGGILWTFGRHDRPWAPERPVYGTVRYMSSDNAARKLRLREYVRRWGG